MQRIGIYPGTFDPIHMGHLSFALASIKKCQLDSVVFLPENAPRGKINVTPLKDRLNLIRAAISAHPQLHARILSSDQFTVSSTLSEIQRLYIDSNLTLIIGSDVAISLSNWEKIDELLAVCDISVGMRSHQNKKQIANALQPLIKRHPRTNFTIIQTDYSSYSSSYFRKQ